MTLSLPGYSDASLLESVDSTMTAGREVLGRLVARGERAGLVVAKEQTAGRGRQGRSWMSAEESFMGTFVFVSDLPLGELAGYSLAVGVAVAEALLRLGAMVKLKWPNDVVVPHDGYGFQKLGGILVETEEVASKRGLLVGLGLNLRGEPASVPRASSVETACQVSVDLSTALDVLGSSLLSMHEEVEKGGLSQSIERWQRWSLFSEGDTIDVDTDVQVVSGAFVGVGPNGALVLDTKTGRRNLYSGHILEWKGIPVHR